MRLLYDLAATQPLSGRFHGGGEYARSVFAALARAPGGPSLAAFHRADGWLDPAVAELADGAGVERIPVRGRVDLQALLSSGRFDRFYSALPYGYHDLDVSRIEFYFTIHGLRPLELPTEANEARYGGPEAWLRARLKRLLGGVYVRGKAREFARLLELPTARRVVVVPSRHTKYSLLARFPSLDPNSVRVFYSPPKTVPGEGAGNPAAVLDSMGVAPRTYFLLISANRWVKNAIRGIEALDRVFSARPDLPQRVLVLGADGGRRPGPRLANPDRFTFRGYVGADELETLYAHAFALLFPSLNEGFGYPPLEAMRYGTPVIASAIGATTEVCGDAVLYVSPFQGDEIEARALALALEPGLWDTMSQRGRRRQEVVRREQESMLAGMCTLLAAESP